MSKKSNKIVSKTSEVIENELLSVKLTDEQIQSINSTLNGIVEVEKEVEHTVHVATSLEYVKWSQDSDDVGHIGILTVEDEDSVTILTKNGEMTFMKNDGLFESSSREEFENVVIPVKEVTKVVENESKMSKATKLFLEMYNSTEVKYRRIDIINKIMEEVGMSKDGAQTYHQTIKTKLKKSGQIV